MLPNYLEFMPKMYVAA